MSARPKAPARRAGSVGVQPGSTERKDSGSASMMPTSTSPTIRPPTGPELVAVVQDLGLLEDVEPQRRLAGPAVLGEPDLLGGSARARRGGARRPRPRRGRRPGRAAGRGWPATRSRCPARTPEICVGSAISGAGSRASMRLARWAGAWPVDVDLQRPVDRVLGRDRAEAHQVGEHRARAEVRVDLVAVADLGVAVAVGGVGELERDVRVARRCGTAAGRRRAARRSAPRRSGRAGTRAGSRAGSARWRRAAPPRRASGSATPSSRSRSTSRLCSPMKATSHLAGEQVHVVARIADQRDALVVARDVAARRRRAAAWRDRPCGTGTASRPGRRRRRPRGWPSGRGSCGSGAGRRDATSGERSAVMSWARNCPKNGHTAATWESASPAAPSPRSHGPPGRPSACSARLVDPQRRAGRRTASGSARRRAARRPARAPGSDRGRCARRAFWSCRRVSPPSPARSSGRVPRLLPSRRDWGLPVSRNRGLPGQKRSCSPPSCSSTARSPSRRAGTASSTRCSARRATASIAAANPLRGLAADAAAVSDLVRTDRRPGRARRPLLRRRRDHERRPRTPATSPGSSTSPASRRSPARAASRSPACSPAARSARRCEPIAARRRDDRPARSRRDRFHEQFCADVPAAAGGAAWPPRSGPVTQEALLEPSGERPLWKELPSWFVFGEEDRNIPAALAALHGRARRRAAGRSRSRARRTPSPSRTRRRRRT